MTQAEMELELNRLRRDLTQAGADDEARRKKVRLLARADLVAAFLLLPFCLFLYLNNDRLALAPFLTALTFIFLGSQLMALAAPRAAERTTE
jgi:hypothetical protein